MSRRVIDGIRVFTQSDRTSAAVSEGIRRNCDLVFARDGRYRSRATVYLACGGRTVCYTQEIVSCSATSGNSDRNCAARPIETLGVTERQRQSLLIHLGDVDRKCS